MKIKKKLIITFLFNHYCLFGAQGKTGSSIHESPEALKHPFKHYDSQKKFDLHDIAMHINTDSYDKPMDEGIWFLICKIEKITTTADTINTNHDTKKLIYDPQTRSLKLTGKKPTIWETSQKFMMTKSEISQIITPRKVILAPKNGSSSRVYSRECATDQMSNTNETEHFCETVKKIYGSHAEITLRRYKADRSCVIYDDYQKDNLPPTGFEMTVYFDTRTYSSKELLKSTSPTTSSTSEATNTSTPIAKCSLSTTRILTLGFASLITFLLLHHFFEIKISIKTRI
jgi:hypothetical protein